MKKKRIVTMGGGTGHFALLSALQIVRREVPPCNVTAIVTATDSGGSSGRLRVERGILPPGDIIQCLLALSRLEPKEPVIELLRRRFSGAKGKGLLGGHSVGNFLLAMCVEHRQGDFLAGLRGMHDVLAVDGEVLPVTLESVELCAESKRGTVYRGEAVIDTRWERALAGHRTPSPIKRVWLNREVAAHPLVLRRIREADVIIMGPGDLWTSILPVLLPRGVREALQKARATKILVTNIMSKLGETDGYTVLNFFDVVEQYVANGVIDVVLYNLARLPRQMLAKYVRERRFPIQPGEFSGYDIPRFVGAHLASASTLARHKPEKLAFALEGILAEVLS